MELEVARQQIQTALDRMRAVYRQPVFDEWAILSLAAKHGGVLAYAGPRVESFRSRVPDDAEPLRARAAGRHFSEGDIEFALESGGTHFDAFMKIGAVSYLVCNHTTKSMADIRADERWLKAQAILFELSEKFRADPLVDAKP
jgi:hypothetical protein